MGSNSGLAIFFLSFFPPKMRRKVSLYLSKFWWVKCHSKVRTDFLAIRWWFFWKWFIHICNAIMTQCCQKLSIVVENKVVSKLKLSKNFGHILVLSLLSNYYCSYSQVHENKNKERFHPNLYYIFKNIIQNPTLQVATLIISKTIFFYLNI